MVSISTFEKLGFDNRFPPTEYTELLRDCALDLLSKDYQEKNIVIAEMGAKDAILGITLSSHARKLVMTDICKSRLALMKKNSRYAKSECVIIQSSVGVWFPSSFNWSDVDLFLFNPPSVPEPDRHNIYDDNVYFSGSYGRNDLSMILDGLKKNMHKKAQAIIVAAEYVTDHWLSRKCQQLRLDLAEIHSEPVLFKKESIDWLIKHHVEESMGWNNYTDDSKEETFSYLKKGWLISHD